MSKKLKEDSQNVTVYSVPAEVTGGSCVIPNEAINSWESISLKTVAEWIHQNSFAPMIPNPTLGHMDFDTNLWKFESMPVRNGIKVSWKRIK